ncbi:MAG: site-2 protease family protein [Acidobacteriota bacterium]
MEETFVTAGIVREPLRLRHGVLLLCTLLLTLYTGTELLPRFSDASPLTHARFMFHHPWALVWGAPFALPLLFILGVHEFGHFSQALRHGIRVTWPYFIPGPPYISLGTFGAFIRLKSIIPTRGALMEVGVMGPLLGFLASIFTLVAGFALSAFGYHSPTDFGVNLNLPLIFQWIRGLMTGNWQSHVVLFDNPVIAAAWIGFFVQGLNLLPSGQLDGGHVLYALFRRKHRIISRTIGITLFLLTPWGLHFLIWGLLLLVLGYGHPPCLDDAKPMSRGQVILGIAAILIFILSFRALPFQWTT